MNLIELTWSWLSDPEQWSGSAGIPMRILEHLEYSGLTMLIAVVLAVPLGAAIGHTGRGAAAVIGAAGALTVWGTALYFWARVVYVPLYAFGVPYVRSLVWLVSLVGLIMVIASLFLI